MATKHTPDRKVRVKGNRVIHTPRGGIYKGDIAERPFGLTTEQAEEQRTGTKIAARQTREAAQRAVEANPRRKKGGTDDLTTTPSERKGRTQKKK
jgi:hypothetical protein